MYSFELLELGPFFTQDRIMPFFWHSLLFLVHLVCLVLPVKFRIAYFIDGTYIDLFWWSMFYSSPTVQTIMMQLQRARPVKISSSLDSQQLTHLSTTSTPSLITSKTLAPLNVGNQTCAWLAFAAILNWKSNIWFTWIWIKFGLSMIFY